MGARTFRRGQICPRPKCPRFILHRFQGAERARTNCVKRGHLERGHLGRGHLGHLAPPPAPRGHFRRGHSRILAPRGHLVSPTAGYGDCFHAFRAALGTFKNLLEPLFRFWSRILRTPSSKIPKFEIWGNLDPQSGPGAQKAEKSKI